MPRKAERFKDMTADELRVQERELSEQVFRLRFQLTTGQSEGLKRLREVRRDLARVKTMLRAQELRNNHGQ
jgi:large subunit ribosomal protein L29